MKRPLIALLLLSSLRGSAQTAPTRDTGSVEAVPRYRYRILGVYDDRTGAPIEDADVVDVLSGNSVKTTSTGTASLLFLPDGGGLVRIKKLGYALQTLMVSISPADTNPLTLVMARVVELPTVATVDKATKYTSPALRGFEDRRLNYPAGYYMSEAQLRKDDGRLLGESLIAHIPSIVITSGGSASSMLLQRSPRCAAGGPPDVYLDGVPLAHIATRSPPQKPRPGLGQPRDPTAAQPIDLSDINVESLAGVEYYPTTAAAPVQYGGTTSACGVMLLWSREK